MAEPADKQHQHRIIGKMKSTNFLFAFALGLILVFGIVFALAPVSAATYTYTTHGFAGATSLTNIRAINFVCTNDHCYNLGTRLSDANSGATNTNVITYSAPSANGHGYATYWFAPNYRAKEVEFNPAAGGSSSANLNFIQYANCNAPINSINIVPASINLTQGLTITANVQSAISEAPVAPYAEPNDADLVRDYFSARTNVSLEVRNISNNVAYSTSSQNYILHDSARNYVFNIPAGTLPMGNYTILITTSVSDTKCSSNTIRTSAPRAFRVTNGTGGDDNNNLNIQFSGLTENPASPATYAPGQNYQFNATVTGNVSSVWMTFNGLNRAITRNGNVWTFTISDLRAGNYTYQWFANDTSGQIYNTSLFNYIVNRAVPGLAITISPSASVQNGTQTTATASGCPNQISCTFYRDWAVVANPDIGTFTIGVYHYIYNTTGNENYTANSVSVDLNVWNSGEDTDEEDATEEPKIIVITDDQLTNGYSVYMNVGDRIKFNFCATPYYIKLTEADLSAKKAYFTLIPGTSNFVLKQGNSEEIDLNLDGTNDIVFKLEKVVSDGRVKIYIKRISDRCEATTSIEPTSGLNVYGEQLISEKKASSIWTNLMLWLLIGILLLLLLILLLLLLAAADRDKKKKKPAAQPSMPSSGPVIKK